MCSFPSTTLFRSLAVVRCREEDLRVGCGLSKSHYQIPEVLVSHRNARLTFQGRLLLVRRVRQEGWAVAHAAKAMGEIGRESCRARSDVPGGQGNGKGRRKEREHR